MSTLEPGDGTEAAPGNTPTPEPAPAPQAEITPPPAAARPPGNGYGTAALVLGIVALVAAVNGWMVITIPLAFAGGILAIVFGVLSIKAARRGEATNGGQGKAGVITGSIAVGLLVVGALVLGIVGVATDWDFGDRDGRWRDRWHDRWEDEYDSFDECLDDARDAADVRVCIDQYPAEAREAGLRSAG
ncbi:MAG: DUF4190 domain-containing protein [Acidimicrobiales bacterium]|nr:DUF4190 domain-containing protein [Acidimicrobiales bacterium]